jgi:hypothetical protein
MIRRLTTVLCTAVLASFSISVTAAETNVVEAFGCNFNDGKTMSDLDAVVKYYTAQRSKIASPALQKMVSRVWTPTLGNVPVDLVWFNSNLTYTEWGEVREALVASSTGDAIQARFDAVMTCPSSGLYSNEALFNNLDTKPFKDDGRVVIESFRCRLHPGKSMADSDAAIAAWKPVFAKAVASTGAASFVARRLPIISGFDFDLGYLLVWDDAVAYSTANEAFRADPAGAKSDALFAAAHRCESGLFDSRTVVAPPE